VVLSVLMENAEVTLQKLNMKVKMKSNRIHITNIMISLTAKKQIQTINPDVVFRASGRVIALMC
jgi:hypothetical protein